jgi:hypothetical protein
VTPQRGVWASLWISLLAGRMLRVIAFVVEAKGFALVIAPDRPTRAVLGGQVMSRLRSAVARRYGCRSARAAGLIAAYDRRVGRCRRSRRARWRAATVVARAPPPVPALHRSRRSGTDATDSVARARAMADVGAGAPRCGGGRRPRGRRAFVKREQVGRAQRRGRMPDPWLGDAAPSSKHSVPEGERLPKSWKRRWPRSNVRT